MKMHLKLVKEDGASLLISLKMALFSNIEERDKEAQQMIEEN